MVDPEKGGRSNINTHGGNRKPALQPYLDLLKQRNVSQGSASGPGLVIGDILIPSCCTETWSRQTGSDVTDSLDQFIKFRSDLLYNDVRNFNGLSVAVCPAL